MSYEDFHAEKPPSQSFEYSETTLKIVKLLEQLEKRITRLEQKSNGGKE